MCYRRSNRIRVLYVEDEKYSQLAISLILKKLGYEIACADNGKLGIEKAQSWKPDIILMDMHLPIINGDEAIRILRNNPATAKIPVFILSGSLDTETQELCRQVGVTEFYAKPVDVSEISVAIKRTLETSNHDKVPTEDNNICTLALMT